MPRQLFLRRLGTLACVAMGLLVHSVLAAEHTKDTLDTVKDRIKSEEALLVDCREKDEWNDGHVKNATFSPLSELKNEQQLEKLLKDLPQKKIIYLHCASGKRCLTAADILKKKGYDVRPLKQGYSDLIKSGFEKDGK